MNDNGTIKVKSTKEAFFPHPRRSKGHSGKAVLIAGLVILGLLVGAGIAAGIIHAIKPLDGESVNSDTYIEKVN